jgi:hypothetical protein
MRSIRSVALAVLSLATVATAYAQLTVYPAKPAAGSMIRIEGMSGCFGLPVEISVEGLPHRPGGVVIKVFDPGWIPTPLMPCPASKKNHVVYGPVLGGNYRVELYQRLGLTPPLPDSLVGTSTFAVTGGNNVDVPNAWSGNWWSPSQSGWAVNLERDPATGNIFMAWYTHEQLGGESRPVWIVAPNLTQVLSGGIPDKLTGQLYRAQGNRGLFAPGGSPIPPAFSMTAQAVGTVTLEFTALNRMTLSYAIAVSGGTIVPSASISSVLTGSVLLEKFTY